MRAVLAVIGIGAALVSLACGTGSPASPSTGDSSTTTVTPPTISAIDPASGGNAGGTTVTITGTNFITGTAVRIGGAYATSVTVKDSTTIVATTPAGTAGTVDVLVSIGASSAKLAGGFTYLPAVDAQVTFAVYNHTSGRLGGWTAALQSGTTVTLLIGSLGEVLDADGNVIQPAIPVDSADGTRMVVREAAANGRVGNYVASSVTGQVSFVVPYKDKAAFDVFVMNAQNGTDYSLVDYGGLSYDRSFTVSRGADAGGVTGPDDAINILVRELSRAVTLPWMSYGRVARASANGQVVVTYTAPNAGACATYTRSKGTLFVNPDVCAGVPVDLRGTVLENGIEMVAGVRDIGGVDSSGLLDWNTFRITPTAQDLLAYVFLKDSRNW